MHMFKRKISSSTIWFAHVYTYKFTHAGNFEAGYVGDDTARRREPDQGGNSDDEVGMKLICLFHCLGCCICVSCVHRVA